MGLKIAAVCILVITMVSNSRGLFLVNPFLNLLAAAGSGNGTFQNNTIALLVAEHIAHTIGSFATIAELAEELSAGKFIAADLFAEFASNATSGIAVAFSNFTDAKHNLTSEALETLINTGVELSAIGAEAAALKPALGLGILGAFGG